MIKGFIPDDDAQSNGAFIPDEQPAKANTLLDKFVPDEPQKPSTITGEFGKVIPAGWMGMNEAVGSLLQYTGKVTGINVLEGIGKDASDYWGSKLESYRGAVENMTDIGKNGEFWGDLAKWGVYNAGKMGVQMTMMAPFMAAGSVAKSVPTGWQAVKALAQGKPGAAGMFGRFLGEWAKLKPMDIPIGILEGGGIAKAQIEALNSGEIDELNPIRGLAAAFVASKLEELGAENAINRLLHGAKGGSGKLLSDIAKGALSSGTGEATEEFFQTYAERLGVDSKDIGSYQQFLDAVNGAGAGFVGGFFLGGGGSAIVSKGGITPEEQKRNTIENDPLEQEIRELEKQIDPEGTSKIASEQPQFSPRGYSSEAEALTAIKSRKLQLEDYEVSESNDRFYITPKEEIVEEAETPTPETAQEEIKKETPVEIPPVFAKMSDKDIEAQAKQGVEFAQMELERRRIETPKPEEKVAPAPSGEAVDVSMEWTRGQARDFSFDPNSTKNEGRFRLAPPLSVDKEYFDKGAFVSSEGKKSDFASRNKVGDFKFPEGIRAIVGKVNGEEKIQALRFNKNKFTEEQASKWWNENKNKFDFYKETPAMARGKVEKTKGLPKQNVVGVTQKITRTWKNAPAFVIHDTQETLPKAIKDIMLEDDQIKGVYHDGQVHLIADNLYNEGDIARTIAHETMGHYGLRLFGAKGRVFALQVFNSKRSEINQIINEPGYDFDISTHTGRMQAADEWIARAAELNVDSTIIDRAIRIVKDFIRKIGFKVDLSNSEIRTWLSDMRKKVIEEPTVERGIKIGSKETPVAPPFKSVTYKRLTGETRLKVPELAKRGINTAISTFTKNPHNLPKDVVEQLKTEFKSAGELKWFDEYLMNPYRLSQKHPEWKAMWRIHGINRVENRRDRTAKFAKDAENFLKLGDIMKKAGYSRKEIKESRDKVARVLFAGDIQLHERLLKLKEAIKSATKTQKQQLQAEFDELQRLRRYSDEELRKGIVDEYGNTIKLKEHEIQAYVAARRTLDNVMQYMEDNAKLQVLREHKNKKWYQILVQATGVDITKEDLQTILGEKKLTEAGLLATQKMGVDISSIFDRIENNLAEVTEAELKDVAGVYKSISEKLQKDLAILQDYISEISKIKNKSELEDLTRELSSAYLYTRPQLKEIKNLRNQMNNWVGYFPRYRDKGKYKARLVKRVPNFKTGELEEETVYSGMYSNINEYAKIYEDVMKRYAKDGVLPEDMEIVREIVDTVPELTFQGVDNINMQKVIDAAISGMQLRQSYVNKEGETINVQDELRKEVLQVIADQFKQRGAMKASIHRKEGDVIKGYQEDGSEKILMRYISAMAGITTKQEAAASAIELLGGSMKDENGNPIKIKSASMFSALSKYNKEMLRNDSTADKVSAKIRSLAFMYYLGGVIKSAVVNLTQNPIVGFPELGKYMRKHNLKGIPDAQYLKAMKDVAFGKLTNEESRLINELLSKGVAQDRYIQSIFEGIHEGSQEGLFRKTHALAIARFFATPFSMSEVYNRKSAGVALFRQAYPMYIKQGLSEAAAYDKAFEDARTFIDNVHYAYGKENRPLWMMSGDVTSAALATAYTFRGYTHNFLARQADLLSQKDFRTMGHTLAYMFILGGLAGVPFFDDFAEWFEKNFGYSAQTYVSKSLKGWGGETLETFGMYGLPAVLGANLSGSLGIGLPYPIGADTATESIFGVYSGVFEKVRRAKEAVGRQRYRRAATELLPEAFKHPVVAFRESEFGKQYLGYPGVAATPRGRIIYDSKGNPLQFSNYEVFFKVLGFNPTQRSKEYAKSRSVLRQEAWYLDRIAKIGAEYRLEKLDGNPQALKNLVSRMKGLREGIKNRGIEDLVKPPPISKVIKASRQIKTKKIRREIAFKEFNM